MTHEENNIGGRAELPGSDEQKVSRLLSTLKRVEAPKDFDFRLKARIANAGPSDRKILNLIPILKYAMPLALFLVVGAGLLAISSYNNWQTPMVNVDVKEEVPPTLVKPSVPSGAARDIAASTPAPTPFSRIPAEDENQRLAVKDPKPEVTGGSRDSHPRRSVDPIMPSNSADKAVTAERPITPVKRLSAKDALNLIGIDAEFENNGWTVKAVKANEVAGILGVKPGDRIQTIEGKPVDQKTEFEGGIKLSRMQVHRDGATVELGPQSKPD